MLLYVISVAIFVVAWFCAVSMFLVVSVGVYFNYSFKRKGWLKEDGQPKTEAMIKRIKNLYMFAGEFASWFFIYFLLCFFTIWSEAINLFFYAFVLLIVLWLVSKISISSRFYDINYLMS